MRRAPDDVVETVQALAQRGDAHAIGALLAGSDAPRAAEVLAGAQRALYWTHKDIRAVVAISHAGIAFLIRSAERSPEPAEADRARQGAKALAYNLGSFTWPGWDEPGIVLDPADVAAGFEAARLNLRLADELRQPEQAKAKAYWLLGAHQLAAGEYGPAAESFRAGQAHAGRSDDLMLVGMLEGYLLLTHVLSESANELARRNFDAAVADLRNDRSERAREYADQLADALLALGRFANPDAAA